MLDGNLKFVQTCLVGDQYLNVSPNHVTRLDFLCIKFLLKRSKLALVWFLNGRSKYVAVVIDAPFYYQTIPNLNFQKFGF